MQPNRPLPSSRLACAALVLAGLCVGCGNDVPLGAQDRDSGPAATGGMVGAGGGGAGGSRADAAPGMGGGTGTGGASAGQGGASAPDAPLGTGGLVGQTGGQPATGGAPGSGGAPGGGGALGAGGTTARGGATGTAGGTGTRCGTIAGLGCPAGQFCDLDSSCGAIADAAGTCKLSGAGVGCTADYVPVCGCDGKTYSNDCVRVVTGVLKASDGACAGGTGGHTGTGGAVATGGRTGAGGVSGTGGAGGASGTGGTGGGGGKTCGGTAAATCPSGAYCDLASSCGTIANAAGTCKLTGETLSCTADFVPVCGCDGKTYSNDCVRNISGVLKAADGMCPTSDGGTRSYATAYLAWQSPGGAAGTGAAVVVSGAGWANTWSSVAQFQPETPPSSATGTYTLTSVQTDDLFSRIASVNLGSLPHPTTGFVECYPSLYFRACASCATVTVNYSVASQLAPELDPVWLWFDGFLGASAATNPRNYCNF